MNATVILKADSDAAAPGPSPRRASWLGSRRGSAAGIGLWVFIGVATALFLLFISAYVMRMDGLDWSPIAMPWQLWLSTSFLLAGSVTLQRSGREARRAHWPRARLLLLAGGACAFAFLGVQLWGWSSLLSMKVMPASSPAGSFFYLLTAMHGLHVLGGIAGWAVVMRRIGNRVVSSDSAATAQVIELCARYWHFLLAVWIVLFAMLGWLTPEAVRFICGTR